MIAIADRAASRRMIIVGMDDSAEAGAAAHWAVREAALRKDDVLLVHAHEVPPCRLGAGQLLSRRGVRSAKRCSTRPQPP